MPSLECGRLRSAADEKLERMMDKRTTLALLLMAALLMIYPAIFMRHEPERTAQKTEAPATPPKQAEPAVPPTQAPAAPLPPKEAPAAPERTVVVETPLYRAEIGSAGGRVQGWQLHYRGAKPMAAPGILVSRGIFVNRPGQPARAIGFTLSTDKVTLPAGGGAGELVLAGEDGFGLRVTETLRFHADSYVVDHRIKVENRHSQAQSAEVVMAWQAAVELPKDTPEKFQGQHPIRVVRLVDGSVHREVLAKISEFSAPGHWIGLESEWYLTALIPRSDGFRVGESKVTETRADIPKPIEFGQVALHATLPALTPGQSWEGQAQSYLGPKEYDRLKAVGAGLENSIYFGGFPLPREYGGLPMEWLVVPILWLMHRFYAFTHNYGIAIILLTVITKVIFFPLTIKSMTSMKAMQTLQPQVNALRSKYKSDPQRLQRETMELYRVHKVNPLGGCLPMVVQIPIFYALYVALSVSVEIQNAPFICFGRLFGVDLWICDLAAHDPTYVLPILMGISMFVQQKMTPVMGDPRQAKMMLFMPVVFTFMFLNLPAGLVLYWTLSNVLQIAQQKYMERMSGKNEKAPARATKKA
jgi:YidC/Oxa1 family membrane protein insertase